MSKMNIKPNCFECKFRGEVAGSAHSSCNVLTMVSTNEDQLRTAKVLELMIAAGQQRVTIDGEVTPVFDPHGVKKGWAMWPLNFDSAWLESCKFFKQMDIL